MACRVDSVWHTGPQEGTRTPLGMAPGGEFGLPSLDPKFLLSLPESTLPLLSPLPPDSANPDPVLLQDPVPPAPLMPLHCCWTLSPQIPCTQACKEPHSLDPKPRIPGEFDTPAVGYA